MWHVGLDADLLFLSISLKIHTPKYDDLNDEQDVRARATESTTTSHVQCRTTVAICVERCWMEYGIRPWLSDYTYVESPRHAGSFCVGSHDADAWMSYSLHHIRSHAT